MLIYRIKIWVSRVLLDTDENGGARLMKANSSNKDLGVSGSAGYR
jgi:hypothetical protein